MGKQERFKAKSKKLNVIWRRQAVARDWKVVEKK